MSGRGREHGVCQHTHVCLNVLERGVGTRKLGMGHVFDCHSVLTSHLAFLLPQGIKLGELLLEYTTQK